MAASAGGFSRPVAIRMLLLALLPMGCSPTLDWRDNVAAGSGLTASFPCHPDRHSRALKVAGRPVQMEMLVCSVADVTYAISFFDVAEPGQIAEALSALRAALIDNVRAADGRDPGADAMRPRTSALQLKGMTPNPESGRSAVAGLRPDGSALSADAAFFSRGLRVYQATAIGSTLGSDAVEPFFAGLKFPG